MDQTRWREVERVLDVTLGSDSGSWPALLNEHCRDDLELRQEVEALLRRYTSARKFLNSPPATAAAALLAEARESQAVEGRRMGSYKLVRQIGTGGSARVFLAERADGQFDQQVALKLLRPGHDSEIDRERFRAERQILASLNHPNIARLLDGGLTDDGLPYLVMELVSGEPIDHFCKTQALPLRKRLEMFVAVAEATQYAHRNLVVHRDLKGSNIFVTADGQVKLLDFGLAKLLEPHTAVATSTAHTTQHWLTPEYAAPEQVRGDTATTLTDVYQLGAVLYELLAGQPPFGIRRQGFELAQAILEREPLPPSAITSREALRGDLDAIVLKALRKEPEQRYESAQAFADDVRRYLSGHTVQARRQTAAYRARRFARRHGWALAAAASVLLLISAYAVTVTVQRARTEQALAHATVEAQKSEKVTGLVLDMFAASGQGRAFGETVTAQELLRRGVERARQNRAQPAVHGQMLDVLGQMYASLGDNEQSRAVLQEGLAVRRRALGSAHVDVAMTLNNLAVAAGDLNDFPAAISAHREALAIRRQALGSTHQLTLRSLFSLALALHKSGDATDARPVLDEWMTTVLSLPPEQSESRATELVDLAQILDVTGGAVRAETLLHQALATRRALLGPRNPDVGLALHELGNSLRVQGRLEESEQRMREAVDVLRSAYPDGHRDLTNALRDLGLTLQRQQRWAEAIPVYEEVERFRRQSRDSDNVSVGVTAEHLGNIYRELGNHARAESYLREAERMFRAELGDRSLMVMRARISLGDVLRARGALAEAEALLLAGYTAYTQRTMPGSRTTKRLALASLVKLYVAQGREDEAAKYRALLAAESQQPAPTTSR